MKNAFIILAHDTTQHQYILQCVKSIREHGFYDQDIIVSLFNTNDKTQKLLEAEGAIIDFAKPIENTFCHGNNASYLTTQKLNAFKFHNYNKLLCLSPSRKITLRADFFASPCPSFEASPDTIIATNFFLLSPKPAQFEYLKTIALDGHFSQNTGWNNCGKKGLVSHWQFEDANGFTGLMLYYYNFLESSIKFWNHNLL